MDQLDLWLLIVIPLGVILGTVVLAYDRLRNKVVRTSTAATGSHRGREATGMRGGIPFTCELVGKPLQWQISLPVESGARFQVTPKTTSTSIGHAIGFSLVKGASTKVRTGDAEFDRCFFLVCDCADTGRRLFSSQRNRDAARRILDSGFLALVHDGEAVTTWALVTTDPHESAPDTVTQIAPFLAELVAAIRQDAPSVPALVPPHIAWPDRIALAASVLFAMAAAAAYAGYVRYPVLDDWRLALTSLSVSLPVAALVAVLALRAPNGTELLGYLVGVLVALPLIGWWGGGWLNGYLDRGPPAVHLVRVLDKYITGDGYPYTYYVTLASWRPARGNVDLRNEQLYGMVQSGRNLVAITTMPGFFGFEWIQSAVNRGPAP